MTAPADLRIAFVGAGTVGTALAVAFSRAGYRVVAAASRSPASARRLADRVPGCRVLSASAAAETADLVFLTVPDGAIAQVVESLPWRPGQRAVHCSGATPLAALASAVAAGGEAGAFHPLQTFAGSEDAGRALASVTFAIEAAEPLRGLLHRMARDLGGAGVDLRAEDRALYHIAGVLASNYLVTLLAEASSLWERFGFDRERGLAALLPLVKGTVHNLEAQGLPGALTGPIARGDVGTVAAHLAALRERAPEVVALYREMARRAVPWAHEKGRITDEEAAGILALVEGELVQGGR